MYQLDNQRATLVSVNPRAEIHGEDHCPAVDFRFTYIGANDMLFPLGPRLRESLFCKDDKSIQKPEPAQGELEVVEPISDLPNLRNPEIDGSIKVMLSGVGYTLRVAFGLGGDSDIVMAGVKVNKVSFKAYEGGSCEFNIRLQVTEPDEEELGRLCMMIGDTDVMLTLTPPPATGGFEVLEGSGDEPQDADA